MAKSVLLAPATAVFLLVVADASAFGIDFIDSASTGDMQCLQGQNMYFVTRIFHDANGGGCDATGGANIETAVSIGYQSGAHAYIFPNPGSITSGVHSAADQVDMSVWCGTAAGLPKNMYNLDIEVDPYNPWPSCSTSSDYILEMIAELWKFGNVVSIYTSQYEWNLVTCQTAPEIDGADPAKKANTEYFIRRLHEIADEVQQNPLTEEAKMKRLEATAIRKGIFNSTRHIAPSENLRKFQAANEAIAANITKRADGQGIQRFGKLGTNIILLWYANWDGQPNFNDFVPFGPFKGPFAKQYNDGGNVCGLPCDLDVAF